MRFTDELVNELMSPELQEAIRRFRDALCDPTMVLLLRRENGKQYPGPDAPTVQELAADAFGPHWLAPGFKVDFGSVVKNTPSFLALNELMEEVVDGRRLSFMNTPTPFEGQKPPLDNDHCHELAKIYQDTRPQD